MITGQWGEVINTTTEVTFVDRTFTYTIPADYRGVPTVITDMEVVVFIPNTQQEVATGDKAQPEYTGLTTTNDAEVKKIIEILPVCIDEVEPKVVIKSLGSNPLNSLDIQYIVNDETHIYNWTGNITSLKTETISLPSVPFIPNSTNTVKISVPEDDDNSNNSKSINFEKAPIGSGNVNLEILTGGYGTECRWNIKDSNGDIVEQGGPYASNQTIHFTFELDEDCYTFTALDSGNDGGTKFTLTDNHETELFYAVGNWGAEKTGSLGSNRVLGINYFNAKNISLYPNPAKTFLNLTNAKNADIVVYDVLGKMILSISNISREKQIDVSKLRS